MRNNDFGSKTSGSRTNVLFSLNENVFVFVCALFRCWILLVSFFAFITIKMYAGFYQGDMRSLSFSLQLPLLLAVGVSLQCCHCVDEVVVVGVLFWVLNIALDSNGFLHLDKWNLLFSLGGTRVSTYCSCIHVWFSSIFHFSDEFPLCVMRCVPVWKEWKCVFFSLSLLEKWVKMKCRSIL